MMENIERIKKNNISQKEITSELLENNFNKMLCKEIGFLKDVINASEKNGCPQDDFFLILQKKELKKLEYVKNQADSCINFYDLIFNKLGENFYD